MIQTMKEKDLTLTLIGVILAKLREGKNIKEHDLNLFNFLERTEYEYMHKSNMNYSEAHEKTNIIQL